MRIMIFIYILCSSICNQTHSYTVPFLAVELFLPHIAVAYGYAPSFSHPKSLSFSMDKLFEPDFGVDLSHKMLSMLKTKLPSFDRFSDTSSTGMPMDSEGEVFDVRKYLPDLQFALDLSPSVDFAASMFRASDLYDALFPSGNHQSLKTFGKYVKKNIIAEIMDALNGLFDVKTCVPAIGLTVDEVILGGGGLSLGNYTNTRYVRL